MCRTILRKVYIIPLLISFLLLTIFPIVNCGEYHIESTTVTDKYDISLNWEDNFGTKDWQTFKLWDDGISTHCYISFKFNTGAALNIPASLQVKHPTVTEPGKQFNIETALNFYGTKQLALTSEFYVRFDLDLPGITTYIPGLGFVDDIDNTYGGTWDYKFNLNSQTIDGLLSKISLGDGNILQNYFGNLNLDNIITVENLDVNSQTLGTLASGTIKIDLLRAIFTIAKEISSVQPAISVVVNALDWLLTNVIKTSSGIILTPKISAQLSSNFFSSSDINLNTQNLIFNQDISTKHFTASVNNMAKETSNNYLSVGLNPLKYILIFDIDWSYYLDIDIDALGLDIYDNSWYWDLGTFPTISSRDSVISRQVSFDVKLDEPTEVNSLNANNGEIVVDLTDTSGFSSVNLLYSEDKSSWHKTEMTAQGTNYVVKPVSSVQEETTLYYYIEAIDGDNDLYRIDNNGAYYSCTIKPESTDPLGNVFGVLNSAANYLTSSGSTIIIFLVLVIIVIVVLVCGAVLYRRKSKLATQ